MDEDVDAGFGSRLRRFVIHVIDGRAVGRWALLRVIDRWCDVFGWLFARKQANGR